MSLWSPDAPEAKWKNATELLAENRELSERARAFERLYFDGTARETEAHILIRKQAAEIERLRTLLTWLNQKGGLGLDVHDLITCALEQKPPE